MEEGTESCNRRKVELGSMGRNYKEPDFILMKAFVTRRAVQNCSEWLCELVSFPSHRGLLDVWGEVPDLAGKVS